MKTLLLHLSDIHILENQNQILSKAEKIAGAISSVSMRLESIFVIISGDIAFSGSLAEYVVAEKLFTELKNCLISRFPSLPINFIIVPGNHDCDFHDPNLIRERILQNIELEKFDESIYQQVTSVQNNYETFASFWRSEGVDRKDLSKLYSEEIYKINGNKIEFHLLNTSWMSKRQEDQGKLFFPTDILPKHTEEEKSADLVITVMHHPFRWFEANNGRLLSRGIEDSTDIILTGHEHEGDNFSKAKSNGGNNDYVEGSVLQDSSNAKNSGFNLLIIDFETRKKRLYTFLWDKKSEIYKVQTDSNEQPFVRNRIRLSNDYLFQPTYSEYLLETGTEFTHPHKDYRERILIDDLFIYPDLKKLNNLKGGEGSTVKGKDIINTIPEEKLIMIVGSDKSGKTTLAKKIVRGLLEKNLIPLLVNGSEIKKNDENAVLELLSQTFSKQYMSPNKEVFLQLDKKERAIILDDFHEIPMNRAHKDLLLNILTECFGILIILGNEQLTIDEISVPKNDEMILWKFTKFNLLPFGHTKREAIVRKWHSLGNLSNVSTEDITKQAIKDSRTISWILGKDLIPSYPIFILMILQQLGATIPVDIRSTTSSYGYLYDALLTIQIARSPKLKSDLDTQYNYLSEFAYFLFENHENRAAISQVHTWHNNFCKSYDLEIDFKESIDNLIKVFILNKDDQFISFKYSYIYYYFVARYFKDRMSEEVIRKHIKEMSEHLHQSAPANIILFLCYLSKDPFIIETILSASRNLFSSQKEFDIIENTLFLNDFLNNQPSVYLEDSDPEDNREKLLEEQDEIEAKKNQKDEGENELEEYSRFNTALKTIQILGQILRNFSGSLKGETKLSIAKECYSLGLRTIKIIFESVELIKEDLVEFFISKAQYDNSNLSYEKANADIKSFIFELLNIVVFVLTRHISDSVGHERLGPTFSLLLEKETNISYRFIDLSVKLDYFLDGFPEEETFELHKIIKKMNFPYQLLKKLVWYHFYIYPEKYTIKDKVCKTIGINQKPAVFLNNDVKRLGSGM